VPLAATYMVLPAELANSLCVSQTQNFVNTLKERVVRKGHGPGDDDKFEDSEPAKFIVGFEKGAAEFAIRDLNPLEVKAGQLTDLMRCYNRKQQKSVELGRHGSLDGDDFADLQLKGLCIVEDQMGQVGDDLQKHMDLLEEEDKLMVVVTHQADSLAAQGEDLLSEKSSRCSVC